MKKDYLILGMLVVWVGFVIISIVQNTKEHKLRMNVLKAMNEPLPAKKKFKLFPKTEKK